MLLDDIAHRSRWRDVHPAEKLILVGCVLAAALLSHHPGVVWGLFAGMTVWNMAVLGHPAKLYMRLMTVPVLFLLPSAAVLSVAWGRMEDLQGALWVSSLVAGWGLGVTHQTLALATLLTGKALAGFSALLFLTLSTPVIEITSYLSRRGLPSLLTELVVLTYRMIGFFYGTATSIQRAQASRCGWSSWRRSARSFSLLAFNLFALSLHHTRRLSRALEARCYTGTIRVLQTEPASHKGRMACMALAGILLVGWSAWTEWGHTHTP